MISPFLFLLALLFATASIAYKKEWGKYKFTKTFLSYVLLLNMGLMGLVAAYMHLFLGPETAKMIGWTPGSPFQFEIGITNLAFGVLGILAFWIRGRFWEAAILGWSILLLGCFVGHYIDYVSTGNDAPWNFGVFIWFNDLLLPLITLSTLFYLRKEEKLL